MHSTEVIDDAANRVVVASTTEPPMTGSRKADTFSMCFQGGTFDRIKERGEPNLPVAVCYACVHAHLKYELCYRLPYRTL